MWSRNSQVSPGEFVSAASRGDVSVVQKYINSGQNLNVLAADGKTAIMHAGEKGHADIVAILAAANTNLEIRNHQGKTVLTHAASLNYTSIIRALVASGRLNLDHLDGGQMTALMRAAANNSLESVNCLIEANAAPDVVDVVGQRHSALYLSVGIGKSDRVSEALITAQADINFVTPEGDSVLSRAINQERNSIALQLLAMKVNVVNIARAADGATPLILAASSETGDSLIAPLIEASVNLNDRDRQACTALIYAAQAGREKTVRALIAAQADLDCQDESGHTALMWAVARGHNSTASLLLNAGANFTLENKEGATAETLAIASNNSVIRDLLVLKKDSSPHKKFKEFHVARERALLQVENSSDKKVKQQTAQTLVDLSLRAIADDADFIADNLGEVEHLKSAPTAFLKIANLLTLLSLGRDKETQHIVDVAAHSLMKAAAHWGQEDAKRIVQKFKSPTSDEVKTAPSSSLVISSPQSAALFAPLNRPIANNSGSLDEEESENNPSSPRMNYSEEK